MDTRPSSSEGAVVTEPTEEMISVFRDEWMRSMQSDPRTDDPERLADEAGIAAVLAIAERDHSPTQDAYDAAVRALEKYRARATIHADTLLKIHELMDEYRGAKALREGVRTAIQEGARQIDELLSGITGSQSS